MSTKILRCSCSHAYQDAKYGRQKRVHNSIPPKQSNEKETWRCTICGKERG